MKYTCPKLIPGLAKLSKLVSMDYCNHYILQRDKSWCVSLYLISNLKRSVWLPFCEASWKVLSFHPRHIQVLSIILTTLRWRHNDHAGVSNHRPHGCLLNRLFRRRSKKTSKLRVTGLCVGNSPGPVNSPHKGPVTRNMFPFDDVIMIWYDSRPCDRQFFNICLHAVFTVESEFHKDTLYSFS